MSLGRNNEAEEVLRQSLALNPEDKDVRNTLKSATDRQVVTPELAKLQNKVRSDPRDAEAWGRLAGALYNAGRHEDAIAAFREAIRLKPDDAGCRVMVSVTERAQAPATQGGLWAAFKTALHRHESIRGYLLLSPTLLVMLALMIVPLLGLVVLSFCTQVYFEIDYTPTLKNYFAIFDLENNPIYLVLLFRSIMMSLTTTFPVVNTRLSPNGEPVRAPVRHHGDLRGLHVGEIANEVRAPIPVADNTDLDHAAEFDAILASAAHWSAITPAVSPARRVAVPALRLRLHSQVRLE